MINCRQFDSVQVSIFPNTKEKVWITADQVANPTPLSRDLSSGRC